MTEDFKIKHPDYRDEWMELATKISAENVEAGGGPFGAVIVRDGEVVGSGVNGVTLLNDPTAHAEVQAVRAACHSLGTFSLRGCTIIAVANHAPCVSAHYTGPEWTAYISATPKKMPPLSISQTPTYMTNSHSNARNDICRAYMCPAPMHQRHSECGMRKLIKTKILDNRLLAKYSKTAGLIRRQFF